MKGYYQIIIQMISSSIYSNPRGRNIGSHYIIRFIVWFIFGYAYFGGWIIHMADISFIALRASYNHGRCYVLPSSLVLLETETRYAFIKNYAYAYALMIWLMMKGQIISYFL
jgi:hypothetical protein